MKNHPASSLSRLFARAVNLAGRGLKRVWDIATGNRRLEKRGLSRHDYGEWMGAGALFGGLVALFAGTCVNVMTYAEEPALSQATVAGVWGAAVALPWAAGQVSSLYRACAHDFALRREKRRQDAAPPAP